MTDIPQDFLEALHVSGLDRFFSDWSPSHQREYLKWISEARKPETRKNRIEKAVSMIAAKRSEEDSES